MNGSPDAVDVALWHAEDAGKASSEVFQRDLGLFHGSSGRVGVYAGLGRGAFLGNWRAGGLGFWGLGCRCLRFGFLGVHALAKFLII